MLDQQAIMRKELLKVELVKTISSVDIREINFAPGQKTGRHLHPCPVIGYIVKGEAVLEVDGFAPQPLPAGSAFHEPAGAIIARFDNASDTDPMTFVAYYLLEGAQTLIEILE